MCGLKNTTSRNLANFCFQCESQQGKDSLTVPSDTHSFGVFLILYVETDRQYIVSFVLQQVRFYLLVAGGCIYGFTDALRFAETK